MVIGDMIGDRFSDAESTNTAEEEKGDIKGEKVKAPDAKVTELDLNKESQLKLVGLYNENLKRMEVILGKYSTDEINIEN